VVSIELCRALASTEPQEELVATPSISPVRRGA
jgi:hypothetical protein